MGGDCVEKRTSLFLMVPASMCRQRRLRVSPNSGVFCLVAAVAVTVLSCTCGVEAFYESGVVASHARSRRTGTTAHTIPVELHEDEVCNDEADREAIRRQLGYLPSNYLRVSARSTRGGRPICIQTYPLGGGSGAKHRPQEHPNRQPFPTLYWLTCPLVSAAVSDLERRGFVKVLEERLHLRHEGRQRMRQSHASYATARWDSLQPEHVRELVGDVHSDSDVTTMTTTTTTSNKVDMLRRSGVAGICDWDLSDDTLPSIKCLHAHYAHYRSGGTVNIVGEWTHQLLLEENHEAIL